METQLQLNKGLSHALCKGVISNDLERLREIFNDAKHCAARLRQLSFLFNVHWALRQRDILCLRAPLKLPSFGIVSREKC